MRQSELYMGALVELAERVNAKMVDQRADRVRKRIRDGLERDTDLLGVEPMWITGKRCPRYPSPNVKRIGRRVASGKRPSLR